MASDAIITVDGLGKRYTIGAFEGRKSFRELISSAVAAPLRWLTPRPPSELETLWALKDVSFEVKRGEVIGIIGRNGAGKSTMLKILSRITRPTTGVARIHGRVGSLLEVGTGFHHELTGRENVFLNGAILGMKRVEIARKFDEIVAFAEIERFIDTPVKHYSSGMYMRLAFAVAAHLEPEILIIDEVLAVGDAQFQKKCLGKMGDVAKQGRTVLFVSHNIGAVSQLTSRVLYLKSGSLHLDAPTQQGITEYMHDHTKRTATWQAENVTQHPLQITSVNLRALDDTATCTFEASDGFHIDVEYVVRSAASNLVVELYLHTSEGIHLMTLGDYDQDKTALGARQPGTYRKTVTLPGNLLRTGTYILAVNSGIVSTKTFDFQEILRLDIVDRHGRVEFNDRRGHIIPLLPWTTAQTS